MTTGARRLSTVAVPGGTDSVNHQSRRTLRAIALGATITALFGGAVTTSAQSPEASQPAANGGAEVSLWTYYGDTGSAAGCVKQAAADYNASQSTYNVTIRNLAFSDFNQQVTTAIAAGTTPDLMIV